jgi:hypothetical protein
MDQLAPTEKYSPFRFFSAEQWSQFRADTPLTLSDDEFQRLRSLNDPVDLAEVERIYLSLSRLLSAHVESSQILFEQRKHFLNLAFDQKTPFIIGIAGVLWAFAYLRTVEPAGFNLDRSFQVLFIVIIGGLASIRGAFFGAALIVVFPLVLSRLGSFLLGDIFNSGVLDMSQRIVLGALIILFLILEPDGLVALWGRVRKRIGAAIVRS